MAERASVAGRTRRPPAMETQERRERIFAAAEGLLCEQGYERVSMAAIAAAAGMSKKTLLPAVQGQGGTGALFLYLARTRPRRRKDAADALRATLHLIIDHVLSPRHIRLCRLVITEHGTIRELSNAFVEMGIEESRSALVERLRGVPPERLRLSLPAGQMAAMLFGGVCGHQLMTALLTSEAPNMVEAHRAAGAMLDGLLAWEKTPRPARAAMRSDRGRKARRRARHAPFSAASRHHRAGRD